MAARRCSYPDGVPHRPTAEVNDVFAFCNHIAWQVGGPVLIHDAAFGVVAYSTLNQPLDEARRAVILRREVPDTAVEHAVLEAARDYFEAGDESFEIPDVPGIQQRRVVSPVRLMGVVVGSIWVAESAGDLHPDVHEMVRSAAKQASLFFQLQGDARKREADVFVRLLLDGGSDEAFLAQYLGVPIGCAFRVLAVWHGDSPELRDQALSVINVLCDKHGLPSMILKSGDRLHVVVHDSPGIPDFLDATGRLALDMTAADDRLLVGLGRVAERLGRIPRSRADADNVIDYLRRTPGERLASYRTLQWPVTLMHILQVLESQVEPLHGPLEALGRLESMDRADAFSTLDAYFAFAGNATEAARSLHVHPNTFRYRLAKVVDMLDVDLDDRETRLMIEIDLLREKYGRPLP